MLFGLKFFDGTYNDTILKSISGSGYNCFVNSHMLYEHYNNHKFNDVLTHAHLLLPDGMPLLYTIRLFTKVQQERIAGNDVMFSLIEQARNDNLSIFLLGGTEDVLQTISNKLDTQHIRHSYYSPPFLPIDEFDFESQANMINEFNPDIIMVGLGCPKQEIWMYRMKDKINAPMYGLGGAFLLYAGVDVRAPKWMRKLGLEWMYRLAHEPRRLFKRYLVTNSFFIWLFIKEVFKQIFKCK